MADQTTIPKLTSKQKILKHLEFEMLTLGWLSRKTDMEGIDIYESMFAIYLNRANNTIGWYKVSQGGITGTVADPKLIIKKALDILACGIIMCHNHPSGNLKPSKADEELTQKIKNGASYFDITLLDHIILTEDSYYSFADEGLP